MMGNRLKILVYSIATMTAIGMIVGISAIYFLYSAAFYQQAQRLMDIAKAQARLIEAMARFDRHPTHVPSVTNAAPQAVAGAALGHIIEAHRQFAGFGETGELLLGRLDQDHIVFLSAHRYHEVQSPPRLPRTGSPLAEPMRRALAGRSGIIVDLDYRGERVMAAHEPVAGLNLGIVAKLDMREIRHPFVKGGLLTGVIGVLCVLAGGLLMVAVNNPLITRVEARLQAILDTAADGVVTIDEVGTVQSFNVAAETLFGYAAADVIGHNVSMLMPSPYREDHDTYIRNYLTTSVARVIGIGREVEGQRQDGSTFPMELTISEVQYGHQRLFTGIVRDISARKKTEDRLHDLIERLTALSAELESMMAEQMTATHQVVATAQEIATTSRALVQTVHDVSGMSASTAAAAENGQMSLARMHQTMATMENASRNIANKLAVINERAANVTTVITTISKVAEQTNLLSLNAAIEAEKAGAHGRGFAVVAREIRRLADQTAEATLDIEHLMKEMSTAVSSGVVGIDQFAHEVSQGVEDVRIVSSQLTQIITQVQALTPRFDTVHQGMQAQDRGAQHISGAMSQLSDTVQQTMASLHASTQAVAQLQEVFRSLYDARARSNWKVVGKS